MTKKDNSSKAKVSEKKEQEAKEEVKQEKDFEDMTVEEQVEFLEESLGKSIAEAEENKKQAQRLQAEFENYRKRMESHGQEMRKLGIQAVVEKMLEVLDNCDRAREYIKDENALMGFNIMEKQIVIALKSFNLQEADVKVGDVLDVKTMYAIEREANDELDGKVTAVFSKGYMLDGICIRPAKVKVGFAQKKTEQTENNNEENK